MAPTLAYWKIRGLAHAIRLCLHYKEVEFEDKMYEQGPPPDFSREEWLKEKFNLGLDWPNLPYYIDGETKITETSAIFSYVGRKYGLDGSTEEAKVRNDITYSVSVAQRRDFVGAFYNKDFETLKGKLVESIPERLEKFSAWLGAHDYFGGSEIVYSDFCMYDLMDIWRVLSPGCLDKFDSLKSYMSRLENLPAVKKYMDSDSYMKRGPFNGATAKWGQGVVA